MSAALERAWRAETAGCRTREIAHRELSHLVPLRERAYRYEEEVPPGAIPTNMRYHAQQVFIENARIGRPPSVERKGIAFETHESAVSDFFDAEEVAREYRDAIHKIPIRAAAAALCTASRYSSLLLPVHESPGLRGCMRIGL